MNRQTDEEIWPRRPAAIALCLASIFLGAIVVPNGRSLIKSELEENDYTKKGGVLDATPPTTTGLEPTFATTHP